MLSAIFRVAASAAAVLAAGALGAQPFHEGTHYERLARLQPTSAPGGRVEIAEVFRYDCVFCYTFEPYLEAWSAAKPDYVELVRVPAVFNERQRLHARAHYTAEALGRLDRMRMPFFREIHEHGNLLDSEAALEAFFERHGTGREEFRRVFDSFSVRARVARAADLVRRYRVAVTPSFVVNGRYLALRSMVASYDEWLAVIEHLAESEHAALGAQE